MHDSPRFAHATKRLHCRTCVTLDGCYARVGDHANDLELDHTKIALLWRVDDKLAIHGAEQTQSRLRRWPAFEVDVLVN